MTPQTLKITPPRSTRNQDRSRNRKTVAIGDKESAVSSKSEYATHRINNQRMEKAHKKPNRSSASSDDRGEEASRQAGATRKEKETGRGKKKKREEKLEQQSASTSPERK